MGCDRRARKEAERSDEVDSIGFGKAISCSTGKLSEIQTHRLNAFRGKWSPLFLSVLFFCSYELLDGTGESIARTQYCSENLAKSHCGFRDVYEQRMMINEVSPQSEFIISLPMFDAFREVHPQFEFESREAGVHVAGAA